MTKCIHTSDKKPNELYELKILTWQYNGLCCLLLLLTKLVKPCDLTDLCVNVCVLFGHEYHNNYNNKINVYTFYEYML